MGFSPIHPFSSSCLVSLCLFLLISSPNHVNGSSGVFKVQRKFAGRDGHHSLADLREHDARRHARILSAVDLDLEGNGLASNIGLYYTDIAIGMPPKNYTVQVDTGSDLLWVNCAPCDGCPPNSLLGGKMPTPYDPAHSPTSKAIRCDDSFCNVIAGGEGPIPECPLNTPCNFNVTYGDGSSTAGYFVTDLVGYNKLSEDSQPQLSIANVSFGCAAHQAGMLDVGLEGIVGFGQANFSLISQLASSGEIPKIFSHCLDPVKGGGIFAIGNVVEPKVNTTPLVPNMPHYNVNLKSIAVGTKTLKLRKALFASGDNSGTIIDSGTTLAYIPAEAFDPLVNEIFANHQNVDFVNNTEGFMCFSYSGSVDADFPVVTFHLEMSVDLKVSPHDYFFKIKDNWCVGWQNGGDRSVILLGDIALSNKLVVYDLENQAIGWTDFDCQSTIKVGDDGNDVSKTVYDITGHTSSPASTLTARVEMGGFLALLAFLCFC